MNQTGILLINLGSPASPAPNDVGRYLKEFLMDELVIDIPAALRGILVHLVIVPRRKYQSARLYQSIWTAEGSPLIANTSRLARELADLLGEPYIVEIGMRYGEPSVEKGMSKLLSAGAGRIVAAPLYPQYAESSYETAAIAARNAALKLGCGARLEIIPPFYDSPAYIDACFARLMESLTEFRPDHVLFSYHSLPVRHLERLDKSSNHCLKGRDCCDTVSDANSLCYRAHCMATTRSIASRAGLEPDFYSIGFQSRLGRASWIGPQTEDVLRELAGRGLRRVAVSCPSFTADCLETLEEIGERAKNSFIKAGGEDLHLVPALNFHPEWVKSLRAILELA